METLFKTVDLFFGKQRRAQIWLFRIVVVLLVLLPVLLAAQINRRFSPACVAVVVIDLCLAIFIVFLLETIRKQRWHAEAALSQAEEKLRQSQKMELIGRLVGGISHDFNNLLTIITGYSELLIKSVSPSDPAFESLTEINQAGDRAVTLVRQLLAFSRRQILEPKALNLNQVVEGMGKMLVRLIGEDIALKMVLYPSLGAVRVDPGQMEQVIMNLFVNSRDAMPEGGKMTLETRNVELDGSYCRDHSEVTPGRYVMLAMTDTGAGMDKPTLDKIFEPFFTTKEEGKGTGLGLATVYGIVKQSGGSIFVYSEMGRGTSFKIYLPRVDEAPEGVAPVMNAENADREFKTDGQAVSVSGGSLFSSECRPDFSPAPSGGARGEQRQPNPYRKGVRDQLEHPQEQA